MDAVKITNITVKNSNYGYLNVHWTTACILKNKFGIEEKLIMNAVTNKCNYEL